MSIPLARQVTKDFFDESSTDAFEILLVVSVTEALVAQLNAQFSITFVQCTILELIIFFLFLALLSVLCDSIFLLFKLLLIRFSSYLSAGFSDGSCFLTFLEQPMLEEF